MSDVSTRISWSVRQIFVLPGPPVSQGAGVAAASGEFPCDRELTCRTAMLAAFGIVTPSCCWWDPEPGIVDTDVANPPSTELSLRSVSPSTVLLTVARLMPFTPSVALIATTAVALAGMALVRVAVTTWPATLQDQERRTEMQTGSAGGNGRVAVRKTPGPLHGPAFVSVSAYESTLG